MKLFNLKIMLYSDYEVLQGEWEKQNADIDKMRVEKKQLQSKLEASERVILTYEKTIAKKNNDLARKDKHIEEKNEVIKIMEQKIEDKEESRKKSACQVGGVTKENHKLKAKLEENEAHILLLKQQINDLTAANKKLEETNEFLKSHRRAPDIEELKDYTLNRKGRRKGFKKAS